MTKSKKVRASALGGALLSAVGAGHYQFVGGQGDQALGIVGSYVVEGPRVQPMGYLDKKSFVKSLEKTKESIPDLRRLDFECADRSRSFTVYFNPLGTWGVPDKGIKCDDGFPLLVYKEDLLKAGQTSFISQTPEWVLEEQSK